jgi:hypothetical protein
MLLSIVTPSPTVFNDSCPSCLENFSAPGQLNSANEELLKCKHRLHKDCYRIGIETLLEKGCYICRAPVQGSVRLMIERAWKKGVDYGSENSESLMESISAFALAVLVMAPLHLNKIGESNREVLDASLSNLGSFIGTGSLLFFASTAFRCSPPEDNFTQFPFLLGTSALSASAGVLITRSDIGINGITGFAALTSGLTSYCITSARQSILKGMRALGGQRYVKQGVSKLTGAGFVAGAITSRVCSCASKVLPNSWRRYIRSISRVF